MRPSSEVSFYLLDSAHFTLRLAGTDAIIASWVPRWYAGCGREDVAVAAAEFAAVRWPGKEDGELFETYVDQKDMGVRDLLDTELDRSFAGFCCVLWSSAYEPSEPCGSRSRRSQCAATLAAPRRCP